MDVDATAMRAKPVDVVATPIAASMVDQTDGWGSERVGCNGG